MRIIRICLMFKSVSKEEAKKLIEENKNDDKFFILDIRTPSEFQSDALKNAMNIDFYEKSFHKDLDKLDKTGVYLIYCRSGNRSKIALQIMQKLGFCEVYELNRGILSYV